MALSTVTDRISGGLPRQVSDHLTLHMMVTARPVSSTVSIVKPWLGLTFDIGVTTFTFRLCRLPGRKYAELWTSEGEEWFGSQCGCAECRADDEDD